MNHYYKSKKQALLLLSCMFFLFGCVSSKKTIRHTILNDFGLPYLDLSRDTTRQFIVDRNKDIYYGHPTTVQLTSTTGEPFILASYPEGGHAKGSTVISKSVDGGRTWTRVPGAGVLGNIKEVPTIHKVYDTNGKERLILFTGAYPARMAVSDDKGTSWSPYKAFNWGGIVVMSDLIPLKNNPADVDYAPGKYMAFFHDDGRFIGAPQVRYTNPSKFILYKAVSNDGGLSWSVPEIIFEDTTRLICEPGVVRSPDGKELAMLLRENSRTHPSQIIFSTDEGKTWTQPRDLPAALTGDRHVLKYAPDGRLVAVFRDIQTKTTTGPTEGDYVAWVGTYEDLRKGNKGQYRVRLLDNYNGWDAGYSGLELMPDGVFVAVTYLQYRIYDKGKNSVVAVRFSLSELDKMLR